MAPGEVALRCRNSTSHAQTTNTHTYTSARAHAHIHAHKHTLIFKLAAFHPGLLLHGLTDRAVRRCSRRRSQAVRADAEDIKTTRVKSSTKTKWLPLIKKKKGKKSHILTSYFDRLPGVHRSRCRKRLYSRSNSSLTCCILRPASLSSASACHRSPPRPLTHTHTHTHSHTHTHTHARTYSYARTHTHPACDLFTNQTTTSV